MAFITTASGLIFPSCFVTGSSTSNVITIDATTEKGAFVGQVYIAGRATNKTISAAGGGSIAFRTNTTTFANGATTLEVGLQDVATGAGPIAQPDGTFDVSRVLTGGGGGVANNAFNVVAMTGGSGSKTLSHGDSVAIVLDMTARAGADSVVVNTLGIADKAGDVCAAFPTASLFTAGAWATANGRIPTATITFDDGTLGILDGSLPSSLAASEVYTDATNPDERGLLFQVPWTCKADALYVVMNLAGATSDGTITLYSDPLGTPAAISGASINFLGEHGANNSAAASLFTLASEVTLTANTDYVLAVKATAAGNITLVGATLGDQTYRAFYTGGTNLKKATRNNSTGAFTAEVTPVTMYSMGVRVSSIDTGAAAAGYVIGS